IGWLIVAVRHRFIDSLRRNDREARNLELVWSEQQRPPEAGSIDISNVHVTKLLGELPEAQRIAVVLHHVDGLPVAHVAQLLGRSNHAPESLIARGRDQLRRLLTESSHDE